METNPYEISPGVTALPQFYQYMDLSKSGGTSNAGIDPETGLPRVSGQILSGKNPSPNASPIVISTKPAVDAVTKSVSDLQAANEQANNKVVTAPTLQEWMKTNTPWLLTSPDETPQGTPKSPESITGTPIPPDAGGTGTSMQKIIPGTSYPSTGDATTDAIISEHLNNATTYQNDVNAIRNQMLSLQNGTYVNPQTQSLIQSISSIYDDAVAKQTEANRVTLAAYTMAGIRSGRSRYAPEIEAGNLNEVMNNGLDKIQRIQNQKASAIAKAQTAANQNDFDNLYKEMDSFQKAQSNETKAVTDLLKQVQDTAKAASDAQKTKLSGIQTQQKIDAQEAQNHAYIVLQYLDEQAGTKSGSSLEEDTNAVKEYAAAHNLNADMLLAKVEELKTTKNKYGSGPLGQYQFYADNEKASGRTPLSYADYQASLKAKTATPKISAEQKIIDSFNKSVVNRTALDKAGNREQFIRQLQTQFPDINPDDISRKVYETYPDNYNQGKTGGFK